MEMDRTSGKGTYITQMSRTSREVDRTRTEMYPTEIDRN